MTSWNEWTTIAEFASAGVLTVSAGALIFSAIKTSALTKKTGTLGDHTKELADDTKALAVEAQLDRELRYRPHILATMTKQELDKDYRVTMQNVGEGSAFRCSVGFVGDRGEFGQERDLTLAPGDEHAARLITAPLTHPDGLFNPPLGTSVPGGSKPLAVVCTDILGIRWRFLDGMEPEPWRPSSGNPPPWTTW